MAFFLHIFHWNPLHSCRRDLNSCDSMGMRCREPLHRSLFVSPMDFFGMPFGVYGRSLKDATSYPDKMLHLTAIRCYIFRRKPVYDDFNWFSRKFFILISWICGRFLRNHAESIDRLWYNGQQGDVAVCCHRFLAGTQAVAFRWQECNQLRVNFLYTHAR